MKRIHTAAQSELRQSQQEIRNSWTEEERAFRRRLTSLRMRMLVQLVNAPGTTRLMRAG